MLKKGSIISVMLITGFVGLFYLVVLITPKAPSEKLENARLLISQIRKEGAELYAKEAFISSELAYNKANEYWQSENKKFILFRDYYQADSCCEVAINLAKSAETQTRINSQNLEVALAARIEGLEKIAQKYNGVINSIPVYKTVRAKFLNGTMTLTEAISKYKQNQFLESDMKARDAENLLNSSKAELDGILRDYFKNYDNWMKWYNSSLEKSKATREYLIVVDKMAKKCELYKNGKLRNTYPIELGMNWMGHKKYKGDKSTPEGIYNIAKKLDGSKTQYYKALLINYPNNEDRKRFQQEKKNGNLPSNSEIGGLIEIHGHGGKGADWTDGCIALKNDDIDDLYKLVQASTPVTIVGSLVPLNKILNN